MFERATWAKKIIFESILLLAGIITNIIIQIKKWIIKFDLIPRIWAYSITMNDIISVEAEAVLSLWNDVFIND